MQRLKKYGVTLLATLCLVTIVLLVTGWGSAAAAQVSSVFVANNASNPVPVQATGTVPVHEQGTASVNVTDFPATQPTRDVLAPGEDPQTFGTSATLSGLPDPISPSVPSGKRFIVNWVALEVFGTTLQNVSCFLDVNPAVGENDALGEVQGRFAALVATEWSGQEQLFVSLDPGDQLEASCDSEFGSGGTTAVISATVSGYYVPGS